MKVDDRNAGNTLVSAAVFLSCGGKLRDKKDVYMCLMFMAA